MIMIMIIMVTIIIMLHTKMTMSVRRTTGQVCE